MHETRLKGYFQGGTLPYGYKVDGRKIVIDEDKIEVVKYIFQQYANGVFVKNIINYLTANGILNKNKPFARNTVYKILRNEKYTGIYRHKEEVIENMYPRIISDELYQKVKAKTKINLTGSRSVKTIYLLRNKLICGYCGMPICAESGTTRHGKTIHYYKCSGRKTLKNGCIKDTVRQEVLEDFIINEIVKVLQSENIIENIVKEIMKVQNNFYNLNTTLKILLKEQKQTQTALDNVMSAIEQGIINNTTNKRMKELESKLEELERQILIEQSKMSFKPTEQQIKEYYADALEKEPLMLINYLIKNIKLYNDKIEITFNSPTKVSPDNQGFLFCTKFVEFKNYVFDKLVTINEKFKVEFYI